MRAYVCHNLLGEDASAEAVQSHGGSCATIPQVNPYLHDVCLKFLSETLTCESFILFLHPANCTLP